MQLCLPFPLDGFPPYPLQQVEWFHDARQGGKAAISLSLVFAFLQAESVQGDNGRGKYPEHPVGIPGGESGFLATNKGSGLLDAEQDRRIDGLEAQGFQLFHSAGEIH